MSRDHSRCRESAANVRYALILGLIPMTEIERMPSDLDDMKEIDRCA